VLLTAPPKAAPTLDPALVPVVALGPEDAVIDP
jgi:hypothetical protein